MRWNASLACAALLWGAGCGRDSTPSIAACAEILAARAPAARVVAAEHESYTSVALDFEIGRRWREQVRGRLACEFEAQPNGGLRLRAAALDGVPFTNAELTVVNADLLLAEMRRAGASEARSEP